MNMKYPYLGRATYKPVWLLWLLWSYRSKLCFFSTHLLEIWYSPSALSTMDTSLSSNLSLSVRLWRRIIRRTLMAMIPWSR